MNVYEKMKEKYKEKIEELFQSFLCETNETLRDLTDFETKVDIQIELIQELSTLPYIYYHNPYIYDRGGNFF